MSTTVHTDRMSGLDEVLHASLGRRVVRALDDPLDLVAYSIVMLACFTLDVLLQRKAMR